ncbi:fibronectin type III domain-containing protein [Streptomyces sp. NBC_01304]|uniref:fibronectin type III domain-containing protein n=1 Tax=Streptomyces sp. NBC_01304 TaxID=2903818 RepID=UPI002E13E1F1|nr:fibronectin type III domain-containing protein [Streptomyces sp. NBC_01304]
MTSDKAFDDALDRHVNDTGDPHFAADYLKEAKAKTDYLAKADAAKDYAKKSDLDPYAKTEQIQQLLSLYAKSADVASKGDLQTVLNKLEALDARLQGLENYSELPEQIAISRPGIKSVTATSFTAEWQHALGTNTHRGDQGYTLTVTPTGPKIGKIVRSETGFNTDVTVTGCTTGTEYTLTITALGTPPNYLDAKPVQLKATPK